MQPVFFSVMMRGAPFLSLLCLTIATPVTHAQAPLLYTETTGQRQITNVMTQMILPEGFLMRSRLSDGDAHDVWLDTTLATTRYHVVSPARRIDYTVTRTGNELDVEGMIGSSHVSRHIAIDARPWYEDLERSARAAVVAGSRTPIVYWIIHPWEGSAYLLQARFEAREQLQVQGALVDAIRVRVSPTGILRLFWSAAYWFRADDGVFVRYEGVRGPPGTPRTVVELAAGR